MTDGHIISDNRQAILDILDSLRRRAENDELLELFICAEDASGMDHWWTATEDRLRIAAYVIHAGHMRIAAGS